MIHLDYLLLSLKTDRNASIGPSYISWLLSSEYKKQFSAIQESSPECGDSGQASDHGYYYPRLQYKIIRGAPLIAAIGEGCQLLRNIYGRLDEVNELQPDWKITEKRLIEKKASFGLNDDLIKYRFLTPWLALSEDSFKNYLVLEEKDSKKLLARALEGNIRSVSRSLGYRIDGDLKVTVNPKAEYIFQRDIHYAGFFGSFVTNFEIPNFLGLGKSVSRGYGAIKRVNNSHG